MSETGKSYPKVYDQDYLRSVDHGEVQTLWYSDGSIGVLHTCTRPRYGFTLAVAPRLQLSNGHTVVSTDPVTISPSIACGDCGLHGFIRNGQWEPC